MYLCAVLKLSKLKLCSEFEVTLKLAVISCRIIGASLRRSMFCATKDSSPCNSTLMNLLSARDRLPLVVWSERKGLLLDCSTGTKENRKEGGQSGPR